MLASQNKINKIKNVLKFGGTSVKDIGRIQHVADIIQDRLNEGPTIVVVSAMGDTTDWLLSLASRCTSDPDTRELDQLLATGEQISIALLAIALRTRGVRAKSLTAAQARIFTDSLYNNARIDHIDQFTLKAAFENNDVLVVAGFQGIAENGDVTTLGRGGSDTSAVALAVASGANCCDIYTDVDGILTADPNVVRDASLLERMSSEDAVELACAGAQVIHPRAVELARHYGIELRVRNTFKPDHQGTIIKEEAEMENYRTITGVAIDKGNAIICLSGLGRRSAIASEVFDRLSAFRIATDLISQDLRTVNTLSFTVKQQDVPKAIKALEDIVSKYNLEISFDGDATKVSLIGSGIATSLAITAKAFGALGKAAVNIKIAATADRRLTFVVSESQSADAAQALHEAFDLNRRPETLLVRTS